MIISDRFVIVLCWNELSVVEKVLSSFFRTEFIIFEDTGVWDIWDFKIFKWWLSASFGLIYTNNQTNDIYLVLCDIFDSIERKFWWKMKTYFWLAMSTSSSRNWFHLNSIETIRWWCSLYHVEWLLKNFIWNNICYKKRRNRFFLFEVYFLLLSFVKFNKCMQISMWWC
jgi:hypothetical protein